MKVAIIGSRTLTKIDIRNYFPEETTEIIFGGAKGIDTIARQYSENQGIKLTEFANYRVY